MLEMTKDKKFAQLVHDILVKEQRGEIPRIAHQLGLSDSKFDSRLYGRALFSLAEVEALIAILGDKRLADCVLSGTPFRVVHDQARSGGELRAETETVMIESGHLMDEVRKALSDGAVDRQERFRILKELAHVEEAVAAIRTLLDAPA